MKKNFTHKGFYTLFLLLLPFARLHAQAWQEIDGGAFVATFSFDSTRAGIQLTQDAAGLPYMFYQDAGNGAPSPIFLKKYNGTTWSFVGSPGFARSKNGMMDITVTHNGTVYTAGNDGNPLPQVYTPGGPGWVQTGSALPGVSSSAAPSVSADSAGNPWCAVYNAQTGNPAVFALRAGVWTEMGASQLGSGGGQVVQLAFDHGNTPYIVYDEANPGGPAASLVVERYNGTAWVKVGVTNLLSTGAGHVIAFDSGNTPYVVSTGDGLDFRVMKLSGGDWTMVGPVVALAPVAGTPAALFNAFGIKQIYLAMGAQNLPWIGYIHSGAQQVPDSIRVVRFDGTGWAAISEVPQVNPLNVNTMAFSADTLGNVYLAFASAFQQSIAVYKLISTKPKPVITFSTVVATYGSPDFSPGATSTNTDPGDPITYTIADTTVATIVAGKVHILKAGTTMITASQAADSNWLAADPVTVRLFIDRASQTLSFPGFPQKKVGDPDFPGGAMSSSGLPVTYDGSDPTIATVSPDGNIHIIEEGAIIVTVHQAGDSNYVPAADLAQVLIITNRDSTSSNPPPTPKDSLHVYASSSSTLTVEVFTEKNEEARLELFDMNGQRIYNRVITLSSKQMNVFQIPIYRLRRGIYYVRITGSQLQLIQKVYIGIDFK